MYQKFRGVRIMAYSTIKDPSAHFQVKTYTGNNADTHAITNDGNSDLQPDLVWIKRRDYDNQPVLHDSNRGVTKFLSTDRTDVEGTISPTTKFQSFDTDGFTTGSTSGAYNASGEPFVAWQWKANGGTTSTNNDGAVTSTVQVNSDAGFSILTYTMNSGSNETVGHGLGVTPKVIIYKARERGDSNGFWHFYTTVLDGSLDYLKLNEDGYKFNSSLSSPTSTTFVGGGSSTASYRIFVAYCFAEVQGYSKFGKYVGNASTDGPFVYTGFKPALIIMKRSDAAGNNWRIFDNKRSTSGFNVIDKTLRPNATTIEGSSNIDFLSNGVKIRNTDAEDNTSGGTYIYMAFGQSLVGSNNVPCTAR